MGIDAILAVGGLVLPPLFNLVKGWFQGDKPDDPESTMSSLALTKPEVLPAYVQAITGWLEAQSKHFNRDVIGTPRQWIIDLRAGIRPMTTAVAVPALIAEGLLRFFFGLGPILDPGTRGLFIFTTSSWFGSRIFTNSDS